MKFIIPIVAVLLSGCATAETVKPEVAPVQQCGERLSVEYWEDYFGIKMGPLNEGQRARFLRGFNASPPASDYQPKTVYLVVVDQGTAVAFFHDGVCLTLIQPVPLPLVVEWMETVEA